ncbi:hypothetical protein K493DRAFT_50953 [Basidiobolus meristosporus CBS 931.73]|uniref:Uncharacterized protein n=1 Tax=Basidiobolus meristosporus CBS 931.73 TaxID=1314790 RepID=A0A1Y1Y0E3_9FUNG|nr:hypothetical protein K493DRAFT_50953 [Basidiobolus meristosporus CBS 931.73]|eukprot:ORX91438.1 hypothetical protein K493DRAFT_50953 [Basidiobolus meristosporus CBS 931.73]
MGPQNPASFGLIFVALKSPQLKAALMVGGEGSGNPCSLIRVTLRVISPDTTCDGIRRLRLIDGINTVVIVWHLFVAPALCLQPQSSGKRIQPAPANRFTITVAMHQGHQGFFSRHCCQLDD